MYLETFRVNLSDWIKANGKKIPEWEVIGECNGMSIHGKIVEFCDYEYEDWNGEKRKTEGARIIHASKMPFKCPISSIEIYLPLSFLYEKEKLRDIKIDNIINHG